MTHLAGMTALARLMDRCPPVTRPAAIPRRYSDGIICTVCRDEKRPHEFYLRKQGDAMRIHQPCKVCKSAKVAAAQRRRRG